MVPATDYRLPTTTTEVALIKIVVDSTADYRWMVLPMRPAGTEGWDEARLASLVTRDALVGVAVARSP